MRQSHTIRRIALGGIAVVCVAGATAATIAVAAGGEQIRDSKLPVERRANPMAHNPAAAGARADIAKRELAEQARKARERREAAERAQAQAVAATPPVSAPPATPPDSESPQSSGGTDVTSQEWHDDQVASAQGSQGGCSVPLFAEGYCPTPEEMAYEAKAESLCGPGHYEQARREGVAC